MFLLCWGVCDSGWVHNSGWRSREQAAGPELPEILGILAPSYWKSSPIGNPMRAKPMMELQNPTKAIA